MLSDFGVRCDDSSRSKTGALSNFNILPYCGARMPKRPRLQVFRIQQSYFFDKRGACPVVPDGRNESECRLASFSQIGFQILKSTQDVCSIQNSLWPVLVDEVAG